MRTTLILFILFVNLLGRAQGIEFFHGSFDEAVEKASKEEKLIFIDAYASWCGPCKRMAANVFTLKEVGEFYNRNFINLKIDMETGEGPSIGKKFKVSAYPTFLFLNAKGELVHKKVGGMAPEDFVSLGKNASNKVDNSADLSKEYENNNRNPDFILKYVTSIIKVGKSPIKIVNDYLATQTDYTTPANLRIIHQAAIECDSKIFSLMIKHKDLIIPLVGKESYQNKIKEACRNTVNKAIEYQIPDLLNEAKKTIATYYPDAASEFGYEADMKYYKSMGEMDNYCNSCVEYAQKYLKNDGAKLYAIASDLEQHHFANPNAMKAAEKIASLAIKAEEKIEYYMVYAHILERNGKIKQAISAAKKAEELSKEDIRSKQNIANYINTLEKTK